LWVVGEGGESRVVLLGEWRGPVDTYIPSHVCEPCQSIILPQASSMHPGQNRRKHLHRVFQAGSRSHDGRNLSAFCWTFFSTGRLFADVLYKYSLRQPSSRPGGLSCAPAAGPEVVYTLPQVNMPPPTGGLGRGHAGANRRIWAGGLAALGRVVKQTSSATCCGSRRYTGAHKSVGTKRERTLAVAHKHPHIGRPVSHSPPRLPASSATTGGRGGAGNNDSGGTYAHMHTSQHTHTTHAHTPG